MLKFVKTLLKLGLFRIRRLLKVIRTSKDGVERNTKQLNGENKAKIVTVGKAHNRAYRAAA